MHRSPSTGRADRLLRKGFLVLLGIEEADGQEDADWLCKKIVNLRVFDDEERSVKSNHSGSRRRYHRRQPVYPDGFYQEGEPSFVHPRRQARNRHSSLRILLQRTEHRLRQAGRYRRIRSRHESRIAEQRSRHDMYGYEE